MFSSKQTMAIEISKNETVANQTIVPPPAAAL
jgi:hypothetical protein